MSVTLGSPVSRETDITNASPASRQADKPRDRRRDPRATVECPDGRIRRIGSAYSAQDIALLRLLVERHCTTPDIARHFNVTAPAIKMLMRRHSIARPRPSVAEILSATVAPSESLTPAASGSASASPPAHQTPGATPSIPTVILLDRFERYVNMVELHEVYNGMARIRHVAGTRGPTATRAGKWLTVPVLQLRFDRAQDRAALIEQAKERFAATETRRAALLQHSSNNGEPDNA